MNASPMQSSSPARSYVLGKYAAALAGNPQAFFCICEDASLAEAGLNALEKTASSLGWDGGVTRVKVDAQPALEAEQLFELVEGLDPLCLVVAGPKARALVEQAYRCSLPACGAARIFGRSACSFDGLDGLLATPAGKRSAWDVLKTLPSA